MKKNTTILCALLISGAIVSCQKEENAAAPEQDNLIHKTVTISDEPWTADSQTKSLYEGGVGVHLNKFENMSVYYWKWAADKAKPEYDKTKPEKDSYPLYSLTTDDGKNITGAEATVAGKWTFTHPAIDGATSYNYYFIIPHNSTNALNSAKTGHSFKLSPIQFPEILNKFSGCQDSPLSFDPTSDCHLGQAQINVGIKTEISELHFKRMFAPLKVTIKDNNNLLGDELIYSVTLKSDAPATQAQKKTLIGTAYFEHSDNFEKANVSSFGKESIGNAVSVIYKDKPLHKIESSYTTWFIVNPTTLPAANLTLSVTTDKRTYTRTVAADEINIQNDAINNLSFDISGENVVSMDSDYYNFELAKADSELDTKGSRTHENPWSQIGCDLLIDVGNSMYNNALRIKKGSGTLTYQAIEGKKLSKIRFYGHPKSSNTSTVSVKSGNNEIGKMNLGYYYYITGNGGFAEFNVPANYSTSDLTFSTADGAAMISAAVLFFEEDSTTSGN